MHTNQILERGKSEEKLTTGHGFFSSFFELEFKYGSLNVLGWFCMNFWDFTFGP